MEQRLRTFLLHTPCQGATGPPGNMVGSAPRGSSAVRSSEDECSQKPLARSHCRTRTTLVQKAGRKQWAVERLGAKDLILPETLGGWGTLVLSEHGDHLERG